MSKNKILVVEDDRLYRGLLCDYLTEKGFAVTTAGSGAEALWSIAQDKPELMLLDLTMPEMPGEHVCRLIKTDPTLRDIIVFILSAKDDAEAKITCLKIGAEEYLTKPVLMEELTARIERFLAFAGRKQSIVSPEEKTVTIELGKDSKTDLEHPTNVTVAMKTRVAPDRSRYGSYRVERLVGKGGMGLVYKAYDEQLDRFVALKVLSRQWTDSVEFVGRFQREAKLIATLSHPGIAQVYSLGQDQGEYFFALLWCPGGSLRDMIRNQKTIGFLKAVDIVMQCARALAAAWQKGVVHRDVKPSNIMFDENQQIKIVDFGIAHSEKVSANLTVGQEILGSPAYMAPEQGRAERVDHRADIYALGMTFFQLLTGGLPFSATTPVEWMIKQATEPFPSYNSIKFKIPFKAYRIIERMTRKKPSDRYDTYAALLADLEILQTELFRERQFKVPSATHVAPVPTIQGDQLSDVLAEVVKLQQSGVLRTRWGPLEKMFLISNGELILYESPQAEEDVWKQLVDQGLINPEQIFGKNGGMEETLNRLLSLQAITLDDFTGCYRQLMKNALLEVFRWPVVTVEFSKAEIKQDSFCKSSLTSLLLEGVRNFMDYHMIRERVPRNRSIVRTPQFDRIFSAIELPVTESFLASRIEGEAITIEVLQMLTGFPIEQITRFIYALKAFDAIEYRSMERKKRPEPLPLTPPPPTPEPVAAPEPTPPPAPYRSPKLLNAADSYFKLAQQAYKKNDFWGCDRFCRAALDLNPDDARYHHLSASARSRRGDNDPLVEESFRKAIDLDPMNPEYRLALVDFFAARGSIQSAIEECKQTMRIDPGNSRAASLLGTLEKQEG